MIEKNNIAPDIIDIDILLESDSWEGEMQDYNDIIENAIRVCLKELNFGRYASHIELSVILADDKYISKINSKFRNKNKPTNVLSFPAEIIDPLNFHHILTHNGYIMLGDIILSLETIKQEALEQEKLFKNHFIHLLIHALLHLLGYDHEIEEERIIMEDIEIKILTKFNINNPYE